MLILLDPLRKWLSRRGDEQSLTLVLPNDMLTLQRVENILRGNDIPDERVTRLETGPDRIKLRVTYRTWGSDKRFLLDTLATVEGVRGTTVDPPD